jgi:hypothetical protein
MGNTAVVKRNSADAGDFIPCPAKSAVTGTSALITIDVTNYTRVRVRGSAAMTYYFNSDTTKTFPIDADTPTLIETADFSAKSLKIVNGSGGTVYVQGM